MPIYPPYTLRFLLGLYTRRTFGVAKEIRRIGIIGTIKRIYWYSAIKYGTFVGEDQFGNKYWQNDEDYLPYHSRWIEPKDPKTYDPSGLPPEWHAWLHHTHTRPGKVLLQYKPKFAEEPVPNLTGTPGAYLPPRHLLRKDPTKFMNN